jgi:hypothetical protein
MDYYQCNKCGKAIKNSTLPSAVGCSSATFHQWHKLGPIGDRNYSCNKCGTVVEMSRLPSTLGCPRAIFHQWHSLGGQTTSDTRTERRTGSASSPTSSGGGLFIFMLVALFGVGSAMWEHFTTPKNTREATTSDSKGGHSDSGKVAPAKESGEVRRAIPITNTPQLTPFLSSPNQETSELLYSVVGIAKGDTLNVRSGPGANNKIAAQLPNGFNGIRIVGRPVMNGTTEWVSIAFGDRAGWVSKQYLQPE